MTSLDVVQEKLQFTEWKRILEIQAPVRVALEGKLVFIDRYPKNGSLDNIILIDPEKQTLREFPLRGKDGQEIVMDKCLACCYWKDSKIVIFKRNEKHKEDCTVGIITLKDMHSDDVSADYDKEIGIGSASHDLEPYIYQDKVYVFKMFSDEAKRELILCLNLKTSLWDVCPMKIPEEYEKNLASHVGALFVSNNKAYIIVYCRMIAEFDVETLTIRPLKNIEFPNSYELAEYCYNIFEEKIFLLASQKHKTGRDSYQIWSFDFESKSLTRFETDPILLNQEGNNGRRSLFSKFPALRCKMFICHDKLVINHYYFDGGTEDSRFLIFSLPSSGKPKSSSKPENLTNLQLNLKKFLIEAPYSDISFEVESQVVTVHKWWLTQKSKYFANMFSSGMMETQASNIKITDMNTSTFKAFLEFLYSDHVELNDHLALELLQQADKYSVPLLKEACEKYLAESLTHDNYVMIGQTAELVDAAALRQAVVDYVGKNMKKLKQRKDFEEISDNLLRDSLVKFIVK